MTSDFSLHFTFLLLSDANFFSFFFFCLQFFSIKTTQPAVLEKVINNLSIGYNLSVTGKTEVRCLKRGFLGDFFPPPLSIQSLTSANNGRVEGEQWPRVTQLFVAYRVKAMLTSNYADPRFILFTFLSLDYSQLDEQDACFYDCQWSPGNASWWEFSNFILFKEYLEMI